MLAFKLLVCCAVAATIASAQVAYSRIIPYDPRYLMRRVPVRRSVEVEPRIQLPITRYFPQVDPQVAAAAVPYVAQEPVAYRLPTGEIYAVPSKWTEEAVPYSTLDRNEENDYDAYEYDSNDFSPVYARPYQSEMYAVPQESETPENDGDLYNDMMVNYFLGELQPALEEIEVSEVQRRSQEVPLQNTYTEQSSVEAKKPNESNIAQPTPSTSTAASAVSETSTAAPVSSSPAALSPQTAEPPQALPKIQRMPQFVNYQQVRPPVGLWREFDPAERERGQKEYLMYKQSPTAAKKSALTSLEEELSRAKSTGTNSKDAFSLVEKLMSSHQGQDPLAEQLDSLKYRNM